MTSQLVQRLAGPLGALFSIGAMGAFLAGARTLLRFAVVVIAAVIDHRVGDPD